MPTSMQEEALPQPSIIGGLLEMAGGALTLAALFDQGLVSGANFLTNILLARAFGIREYGVFALAWIGVLFANSLQYALVVTPMMSVGPKQDQSERPSYFGAVLVQEIVFVCIAAVGMFLGIQYSNRLFPGWKISGLALPVCVATFAYLLQEFLRRYFFCTRQSKRALVSDIVSYITQVPIIFWIGHRHIATLSNALWIIALTSLAGLLVCVHWFEPVKLGWSSFKAVSLRHWKISRWLAPTAFLQWGAGNLFLLSAPVFYGAAASGALRAANNIIGVAHVWFLGLDNVVPAEAARRFGHSGPHGLMRYLRGIFFRWGGLTLCFVGIVAAFPGFWLHIVYGNKYSQDVDVLRLYALLYLVIFTLGPLRAGLQAMEYTAPVLLAYPVLIVFSVSLAKPFARGFGLNGVLFGMCCVQFIMAAFMGTALFLRIGKLRRLAAEKEVIFLA